MTVVNSHSVNYFVTKLRNKDTQGKVLKLRPFVFCLVQLGQKALNSYSYFISVSKAEFDVVDTFFFTNRFPSLRIFANKKVVNQKN